MLVGPTGGGKTRIFALLRGVLTKITGTTHKDSRFNPKAITVLFPVLGGAVCGMIYYCAPLALGSGEAQIEVSHAIM